MSMVPVYGAEVKVRPSPLTCSECNGTGQVSTAAGGLDCCRSCDGLGRVPLEPEARGYSFLATAGLDVLESSLDNETTKEFVTRVEDGWELSLEDVTIWLLPDDPQDESSGPTLIAILRGGPCGQAETLWL
jgi:hypothetical protein